MHAVMKIKQKKNNKDLRIYHAIPDSNLKPDQHAIKIIHKNFFGGKSFKSVTVL